MAALHPLACLLLACALLFGAAPAAAAEFQWVEGESTPDFSSFNQHSWYSAVDGSLLSPGSPDDPDHPGSWAAHYANDSNPVQAGWTFTVEEGGPYAIWARVGSYRVNMWAEVDGGGAIDLDLDDQARETVNLVYPTLDIRFLSWVKVTELDLDPGPHQITFGLLPHEAWAGASIYGGVDAFVVTNLPRWAPTGALQPDLDEAALGGESDWFPFLPKEETAGYTSEFDRSGLLERPAGLHGPLHRSGSSLEFEDGTPIRLWGVDAGSIPGTPELRERQARFWASLGINAVRLHSVGAWLGFEQDAAGQPVWDAERLDALDHWFATLAEQGIYSCWSVFYPYTLAETDDYPAELRAELSPTSGGWSTSGVATFRPEIQAAEDRWVTALLQHENPYTGRTYAVDAALASIELRNEDSVFWHWPLNSLTDGSLPAHEAALQADWAEWLKGRYADDAALLAAWGPEGSGSRAGDSLNNPAMGIYAAWEMGAGGPVMNPTEVVRMGDFIRFLAELQRQGYEDRAAHLRELGFQGLIISTAWMAGGDGAHLANAWTDEALDVVDRHAYEGGGAGSWRITTGEVDPWTHFDHPGEGLLSVAASQEEDHPVFMTEWGLVAPDPFHAEAVPLVGLYDLGLQGFDGSFQFTSTSYTWVGGWPGNLSFFAETPGTFGLFPALSTAVIEGHVAEAPLAAAQRLSLDAVMSGVDARVHPPAGEGFDGGDSLEVPAAVNLLGRVSHQIDGGGTPERADWGDLSGTITSLGGDLRWDVPGRFATVRSAGTQGVVGFAGGQTLDLPDATIALHTDYAVLLLTALDGRPLAESERILLSAVARDRQTGAEYNADDTELLSVGGPPLLMEPVVADLQVAGLSRVVALDVDGVERVEVPVADGAFTIDGRWKTCWYLLLRGGGGQDSGLDSGHDSGDADGAGGASADGGSKGGCGCASGPGGAPLAGLLIGLAALVRRRR